MLINIAFYLFIYLNIAFYSLTAFSVQLQLGWTELVVDLDNQTWTKGPGGLWAKKKSKTIIGSNAWVPLIMRQHLQRLGYN